MKFLCVLALICCVAAYGQQRQVQTDDDFVQEAARYAAQYISQQSQSSYYYKLLEVQSAQQQESQRQGYEYELAIVLQETQLRKQYSRYEEVEDSSVRQGSYPQYCTVRVYYQPGDSYQSINYYVCSSDEEQIQSNDDSVEEASRYAAQYISQHSEASYHYKLLGVQSADQQESRREGYEYELQIVLQETQLRKQNSRYEEAEDVDVRQGSYPQYCTVRVYQHRGQYESGRGYRYGERYQHGGRYQPRRQYQLGERYQPGERYQFGGNYQYEGQYQLQGRYQPGGRYQLVSYDCSFLQQ